MALKVYKYATFCDGNPPTKGVTHLIREVEPDRWEMVAVLPFPGFDYSDMIDQLNAAYDILAGRVPSPTPPTAPTAPKPPMGLLNDLTDLIQRTTSNASTVG